MNTMKLELRTNENVFVSSLSNDNDVLGNLNIIDGMIIHVVDKQSITDDDSNVPKYDITEEAYQKRQGLTLFLLFVILSI
jgi:hypothetical protein